MCLKQDVSREKLFNNTRAMGEGNDGKRYQVPFANEHQVHRASSFRRHIERVLRSMFPHHQPRDMVILFSYPGCQAQIRHTD